MRRISVILSIFFITVNIAYAAPYIYITDNWPAHGTSFTDEAIFTGYSIFPETLGITDLDADMICYDWDNNGNYDNCYWDSDGCGGSCNANSCDYYSTPLNMPDSWK